MQNGVDLTGKVDEVADIVMHEFEMTIASQVRDVVLGARDEIVNRHHPMTIAQESIAQMRSYEAGAACD